MSENNNTSDISELESPNDVPREQYVDAVVAVRDYILDNDGATKRDILSTLVPEENHPLGHNGVTAQVKGTVPSFRDWWWQKVAQGLETLPEVRATDDDTTEWQPIDRASKE